VRGPQGALFGKNTNVGAISVISRAPSHDYQAEVRTDAEMAVGGWSSSSFITGGLSDRVSARLSVSAGSDGAYIHNRLTKKDEYSTDYPGAACAFNAPVTCVAKTNNLKGYDLTRAPKWKGNVYLQLQGQVGENLKASARVSADYTDLVYYQSDMNPLNAQKAFTKVNARIGIKNDAHNWEVALVGRNLSNQVTFSQAFNVPLIGSNSHGAMIAPPRTVSLELSKRF